MINAPIPFQLESAIEANNFFFSVFVIGKIARKSSLKLKQYSENKLRFLITHFSFNQVL